MAKYIIVKIKKGLDVVMFIYREAYYDRDCDEKDVIELIAVQKSGYWELDTGYYKRAGY